MTLTIMFDLTSLKIVEMCQRGVRWATPFGMLAYSYGFKILHNIQEYLEGSNPAAAGRLSWTASWWAHYDAQEVLAMDEKTQRQIVALQCAVRVMDGTAGGYTKEQIQQSKLELMNLILELESR